jgi:Tol biopolymer transport system component
LIPAGFPPRRLGVTLGLVLPLAVAACGPGSSAPASGSASPGVANQRAAAASGSALASAAGSSIQGKLAFSRDGNIWVYAGSGAREVTTVAGAADPDWSPDGSILAFDKQDKNSADLYTLPYPQGQPRALSNNTNRVVENNLWEMQPDWSPDGLSLAYASDRGRIKTGVLDPGIWRVTLASGARVQLAGPRPYSGGIDFPRWRPGHASQLVYTSWAYDAQSLLPYGQLTLQDANTNRSQDLTPPNETVLQPAWSPDGAYLAFVKREPKNDSLWIMPMGDTLASTASATPAPADAKIATPGAVAHPVWAPDGHAIAYIGLKDGSLDIFVQALNQQLQPDGAPLQLTSGWHVEAASSISWGR